MARLFSDGTLFFRWHDFFSDGTLFFRWHAFFSDGTLFSRWHAHGTLFFRWHAIFALWHANGTPFFLHGMPMVLYLIEGKHGTPFSKLKNLSNIGPRLWNSLSTSESNNIENLLPLIEFFIYLWSDLVNCFIYFPNLYPPTAILVGLYL